MPKKHSRGSPQQIVNASGCGYLTLQGKPHQRQLFPQKKKAELCEQYYVFMDSMATNEKSNND